ncbi:23 kDa jasmonate-induced protein-like [Silene latifolia]|uniref:23 kDa jasmonate-induced protein-like n=1 Tax=Silene latifolia TaxID=37657 RepID=UPI003D77561D
MSEAFGLEVSMAYVRALPRYRGRTVTQVDLAREAIRYIQSRGKNMDALSHALQLKAEYGNGVSAHCLIYNASGTRLEEVERRNWSGSIFKMEPPRSFENGQWISFLHVKPAVLPQGSIGAVVYRGTGINGLARDFLVAWNCPWSGSQNSVLTEVRAPGYFSSRWNSIYTALRSSEKMSRFTSAGNFESSMTIGGVTSPEYIAVLQHKFQPLPEEL